MGISTRSLLVAAALAAATGAPSVISAVAADNASPRRHVVEIENFNFAPAVLEVSPGDTIVWINRDIVPHTATATDKGWDTGTIKTQGESQFVVPAVFTDAYICRFHPTMKARIRVVQ